MKDTVAYRIFHGVDFNKFPYKLLRPLKTKLYPITSLFIVETPYAKFYLDDMVKATNTDDFIIDDLRPDDVVLDIGACIGGFALRVHKQVKKVYAVEPIMYNRLIRNIKLNNANNIDLVNCGLGIGNDNKISWAGYSEETILLTLSAIKFWIGAHPTFLKLDAEGAEYCIKPEELKGIRRIEAEVHKTKEHAPQDFLDVLNTAGFIYKYKELTDELSLVHAWGTEQ